MDFTIRQEESKDHHAVALLIEDAFRNERFSDHQEQFLVHRLRQAPGFIPELSLVAVSKDQLVGYLLLTKISIVNEAHSFDSLALVPVAVGPLYQRKGVGKALIAQAEKEALKIGFTSIVLLGQDSYFPKLNYELCSKYNIQFPLDIPEKYCMVKALKADGLNGVRGVVEYPEAFY